MSVQTDLLERNLHLRKPRPPVALDEPFDFYEFEDDPQGTDTIKEIVEVKSTT